MVFTMAAEITSVRGVVPATLRNACAGATYCSTWGELKSCGLKVAEMSSREFSGAMAFDTGDTFTFNMLSMLTRVVTVILRRTSLMTRSTLGIDINGAS